jgi:hypothetical protein
MMNKKQITRLLFWGTLACLLVGALVLAYNVNNVEIKPFASDRVGGLLTTLFVLALFVERTLEVFITAWRGKETVRGENNIQAGNQALARDPRDEQLQASAKEKVDWLADYKSETQAIALRSGLVLGILIAAVGVRSFDVFVDQPTASPTADSIVQSWYRVKAGIFRALDALVSGGIIGGGSEAIHKIMNVITEFLDATAKKVKNS